MPFLNNNKFKEIKIAAGDGNEKAQMVLQALRQGSQDDLDRLVEDFYSIPSQDINDVPVSGIENNPMENSMEVLEPAPQAGEVNPGSIDSVPQVEDLTEILDKETTDLFDENEIEPMDFMKFLNNKKRDTLRASRNSDYFKAFNPEGKENYLTKKKEAYKAKFGDSLHDIDRQYNDYDKSISLYSQKVGDLLDDDVELDMNNTSQAYSDIMDNNGIMHCFGRHWDESDTQHVVEDLREIVSKYGKKNVMAALNVLKDDNNNFKNYRVGQINEEVERYNKSLDKILK